MTHRRLSEKQSGREVDFLTIAGRGRGGAGRGRGGSGELVVYSVGKGEPLKVFEERKGSHPELCFTKIA